MKKRRILYQVPKVSFPVNWSVETVKASGSWFSAVKRKVDSNAPAILTGDMAMIDSGHIFETQSQASGTGLGT